MRFVYVLLIAFLLESVNAQSFTIKQETIYVSAKLADPHWSDPWVVTVVNPITVPSPDFDVSVTVSTDGSDCKVWPPGTVELKYTADGQQGQFRVACSEEPDTKIRFELDVVEDDSNSTWSLTPELILAAVPRAGKLERPGGALHLNEPTVFYASLETFPHENIKFKINVDGDDKDAVNFEPNEFEFSKTVRSAPFTVTAVEKPESGGVRISFETSGVEVIFANVTIPIVESPITVDFPAELLAGVKYLLTYKLDFPAAEDIKIKIDDVLGVSFDPSEVSIAKGSRTGTTTVTAYQVHSGELTIGYSVENEKYAAPSPSKTKVRKQNFQNSPARVSTTVGSSFHVTLKLDHPPLSDFKVSATGKGLTFPDDGETVLEWKKDQLTLVFEVNSTPDHFTPGGASYGTNIEFAFPSFNGDGNIAVDSVYNDPASVAVIVEKKTILAKINSEVIRNGADNVVTVTIDAPDEGLIVTPTNLDGILRFSPSEGNFKDSSTFTFTVTSITTSASSSIKFELSGDSRIMYKAPGNIAVRTELNAVVSQFSTVNVFAGGESDPFTLSVNFAPAKELTIRASGTDVEMVPSTVTFSPDSKSTNVVVKSTGTKTGSFVLYLTLGGEDSPFYSSPPPINVNVRPVPVKVAPGGTQSEAIGEYSREIAVSLQDGGALSDLTITPTLSGVVFEPETLEFKKGDTVKYFRFMGTEVGTGAVVWTLSDPATYANPVGSLNVKIDKKKIMFPGGPDPSTNTVGVKLGPFAVQLDFAPTTELKVSLSRNGVVVEPAEITFGPGETAKAFFVTVDTFDFAASQGSIKLETTLSGADALQYNPVDFSLTVFARTVAFKNVNNVLYVGTKSDTITVELSQPSVGGLTVNLKSEFGTFDPAKVVFGVGHQTAVTHFTPDVVSGSVVIQVDLEGADKNLFIVPDDLVWVSQTIPWSITWITGGNQNTRTLLPIGDALQLALSKSGGSADDDVQVELFSNMAFDISPKVGNFAGVQTHVFDLTAKYQKADPYIYFEVSGKDAFKYSKIADQRFGNMRIMPVLNMPNLNPFPCKTDSESYEISLQAAPEHSFTLTAIAGRPQDFSITPNVFFFEASGGNNTNGGPLKKSFKMHSKIANLDQQINWQIRFSDEATAYSLNTYGVDKSAVTDFNRVFIERQPVYIEYPRFLEVEKPIEIIMKIDTSPDYTFSVRPQGTNLKFDPTRFKFEPNGPKEVKGTVTALYESTEFTNDDPYMATYPLEGKDRNQYESVPANSQHWVPKPDELPDAYSSGNQLVAAASFMLIALRVLFN